MLNSESGECKGLLDRLLLVFILSDKTCSWLILIFIQGEKIFLD